MTTIAKKYMYINPDTLLFEKITPEQADEIQQVAEAILFDGKIANPRPIWLDAWLVAASGSSSQTLFLLATVFPARAFLSVLRHREAQPLSSL